MEPTTSNQCLVSLTDDEVGLVSGGNDVIVEGLMFSLGFTSSRFGGGGSGGGSAALEYMFSQDTDGDGVLDIYDTEEIHFAPIEDVVVVASPQHVDAVNAAYDIATAEYSINSSVANLAALLIGKETGAWLGFGVSELTKWVSEPLIAGRAAILYSWDLADGTPDGRYTGSYGGPNIPHREVGYNRSGIGNSSHFNVQQH